MKLQFLGDSRDALKWDFLHWIVTRGTPSYDRLLFIPMLTPDDPESTHGNTPPNRFLCRPQILSFLQELREEPRTLDRVRNLGSLPELQHFILDIYSSAYFIGQGWHRPRYWCRLTTEDLTNTVVFVDPDNGFESKTQCGEQHLRFGEAYKLLTILPSDSVMVVYQHRPQGERWSQTIPRLVNSLDQKYILKDVSHSNVAFICFGKASNSARWKEALRSYFELHPELRSYINDGG